nr:PqiC family protein [Legionella sp. PL877]
MYVLAPIPPQKHSVSEYKNLRIGIDSVNIPAYIEKPQLMLHTTSHRLEPEEYHQWAEAVDKNIMRVVETDLSTLLPGSIVESSPWDSKFKPNYHLQIDISQFEMDICGSSKLRAEYLIYYKEALIKRGKVYYHSQVPKVTIEALVMSMNANLTRLTRSIAKVFSG